MLRASRYCLHRLQVPAEASGLRSALLRVILPTANSLQALTRRYQPCLLHQPSACRRAYPRVSPHSPSLLQSTARFARPSSVRPCSALVAKGAASPRPEPAMPPKKKAAAKPKPEDVEADRRKAARSEEAFRDRSKGAPPDEKVNPKRIRILKPWKGGSEKKGPVVYWMSRDQRMSDNWALLYAAQQAKARSQPFCVAFNLVPSFLNAQARHFGFMLRGLQKLETKLAKENIPFFLFKGNAEDTISSFVGRCDASLLVMDFSSLRIGKAWREGICTAVASSSIAVHEVDAHCTVPTWVASDKMEHSARTIRTKIHNQLGEFLVEYPELQVGKNEWTGEQPQKVDWGGLIKEVTRMGSAVPEVEWILPGEDAGREGLLGEKGGFLITRLKSYGDGRNDPTKPGVLSGLSPWLHYGHLSSQRCALEARKRRKEQPKSVDSFLEELVVRSGLADNYCNYQPNYDNLEGAWDWARTSLQAHAGDKRDKIYSKEQLELGKTHDELWNAAQLEMVHMGKMHGFMRMYWAKKILEWTQSPEQALDWAMFFNDKYELDGRDPNGYVGCMWAIAGVHDQGWAERAVFGKIRFMNYDGCKRKFNIAGYTTLISQQVKKVKEKQKAIQKAAGSVADVAAANAAKSAKEGGGIKAEVNVNAVGKPAEVAEMTEGGEEGEEGEEEEENDGKKVEGKRKSRTVASEKAAKKMK